MDIYCCMESPHNSMAFAYNSKINLGIDDAGTVKHKVFNIQVIVGYLIK